MLKQKSRERIDFFFGNILVVLVFVHFEFYVVFRLEFSIRLRLNHVISLLCCFICVIYVCHFIVLEIILGFQMMLVVLFNSLHKR